MRILRLVPIQVLEDTHERHIVNDLKADVALGLYLVRGDNVVLLGEIDAAKEAAQNLKDVDIETVMTEEDKVNQTGKAKTEWNFENLDK